MTGAGDTAVCSVEGYFQITSPLYPLILTEIARALQQYRNTGASRWRMQRLPARIVPVQDTVPDFLGRLGKPEQFSILRIDNAFIDQEFDIDGTTPIGFAHQYNGDWLDFPRLYESQNLEQF